MKINCGWCNKEIILDNGEYNARMKRNKRGKLFCSVVCGLKREITNEKTCPMCKEVKDRSEFYKNNRRYDGSTVYCKVCYSAKHIIDKKLNPHKSAINNKKRRLNLRVKLFSILGQNSCIFCDCSTWQCLQIEHKNGNGNKDKIRFKYLDDFYSHYINNPIEAKEELQICCANCNWIKRFKNNEHLK